MNKNIFWGVGVLVLLVGGYFLWQNQSTEPMQNETPSQNTVGMPSSTSPTVAVGKQIAVLKTSFGTIRFELYGADAPKTVLNFVSLAGKKFYDGLTFHRVIKGFMIQGGDPYCVDYRLDIKSEGRGGGPCGAGGPGYKFEDELNPNTESYKAGYKKGVVAMANAGPNTNGSQFFIMLADYPLPNNYTIFGK